MQGLHSAIVLRYQGLTEEALEGHLDAAYQALRSKPRDAEFLEAMRQLFMVYLQHSRPIATPQLLVQSMYAVLVEDRVPPRTRLVCTCVMKEMAGGVLPIFFQENFGGNFSGYDRTQALFVLPLLLLLGSDELLRINIPTLLEHLKEFAFHSVVLPGMLRFAKRISESLDYDTHIRPFEDALSAWLLQAAVPIAIPKATASPTLFARKRAPVAQVSEQDGTPCQNYVTVLNYAVEHNEEHVSNMFAFSVALEWLCSMYLGRNTTEPGLRRAKPSKSVHALASTTREAIITYCTRLMEQAELSTDSNPLFKESFSSGGQVYSNEMLFADEFAEATLLEAVRIMDTLCYVEPSLVPRIFSVVKRAYQHTSGQYGAYAHLGFLQFFLNHGDVVGFDIEPILKSFFISRLSRSYTVIMIAFETFMFCLKNKAKLLSSTGFFANYYPQLFKFLAWFPRSCLREFTALLPAMVGPSTFLDVFHSLLDLAVLTAVLEKTEKERDPAASSKVDPSEQEFRPIITHFTRCEPQSVFLGNPRSFLLLQRFTKLVPMTPRMEAVGKVLPTLLDVFFEVMLTDGPEDSLRALVPVLFDRISQLFLVEKVQQHIRQLLVEKVMAILYKFPSFVISMKTHIIDVIGDMGSPHKEEVVIHLCWAVGDYAGAEPDAPCTPAILNDFLEALELVIYERMSVARSLGKPVGQQEHSDVYTTRLMHAVISALAKIAARCQDLSPRVLLALGKIIKHRDYFDQRVTQRANECVRVLKFPSIATAVFGTPCRIADKSLSHVDVHTSLPFMLQSTVDFTEGERLHVFSLADVVLPAEEDRGVERTEGAEEEEEDLELTADMGSSVVPVGGTHDLGDHDGIIY